MTLLGKMYKRTNGVKNFRHGPVGCVRALPCNVIAYLVQVCEGAWVKRVATAYTERLRCASFFAFRRAKASSPSIGFTVPLFRSS
jgi:hypothetical protein